MAQKLVERVAATVPEVPAKNIFAEPRAASTAPALAWAAHWIAKHDSGGQMLSLHADWAVGDDRAFRAAAAHALVRGDVARAAELTLLAGFVARDQGDAAGVRAYAREARRLANAPSVPVAQRAAILSRIRG